MEKSASTRKKRETETSSVSLSISFCNNEDISGNRSGNLVDYRGIIVYMRSSHITKQKEKLCILSSRKRFARFFSTWALLCFIPLPQIWKFASRSVGA